MGDMKKLLQKTIRPYAWYALVVLVLSIPAYFVVLNGVWQRELDKHHNVVRKKIELQLNSLHLSEDALRQTIRTWNHVQPGSQLQATDKVMADRYFNTMRFDSFHNEREQFRCLTTHVTLNGKPYRLKLETNMEEVDETILIIAGVTMVFFVLLLYGFIVLNRRLSRKVWKPFYNTLQQLRGFDLHRQKAVSFPASDVAEFNELNQTLTRLIEKNIALYHQQKEFTENASHELQTPLAILKSRLDLVIQHPSLTPEQAEQINALNIPLSRISRINKNLLLLAKLENQGFEEESPLQVADEVRQCVDFLSDHLESRGISFGEQLQPIAPVTANKGLFEILLNNLLVNAIRHTPQGGRAKVTLAGNSLQVANSGPSALITEQLFERFSANSAQNPGSGLGLAIVKQICKRYGWQVAYDFRNGMHEFTISF